MGFSGKNTEVVCHSLLQWTTLCQTSPPWPIRLGWPHTAWLSFTELDKAVVLWADWLVFCDYGFILSALCCPLATPTVSLGCLWPWTWAISSRLLQQGAATAPYLGPEVSLKSAPPDLEHGVAPLSPPAPVRSPLLGCGVCSLGHGSWPQLGVTPLCCRPWLRMWGSYSRLLLHCAAAVGNKGKMEKNGKKNAKKQNGCLRNPHK